MMTRIGMLCTLRDAVRVNRPVALPSLPPDALHLVILYFCRDFKEPGRLLWIQKKDVWARSFAQHSPIHTMSISTGCFAVNQTAFIIARRTRASRDEMRLSVRACGRVNLLLLHLESHYTLRDPPLSQQDAVVVANLLILDFSPGGIVTLRAAAEKITCQLRDRNGLIRSVSGQLYHHAAVRRRA
ncbi:hypothetical protein KUCAC02_034272, partial [Chaenocephalus aceratus]